MHDAKAAMKPEPDREEALFNAAIQLPTNVARRAFLDQACTGDAQDGELRLWDFQNQRQLKAFREHTGLLDHGIDSLSFSRDDRWLASSCGDTFVIYDLADHNKPRALPPVNAHRGGTRQ